LVVVDDCAVWPHGRGNLALRNRIGEFIRSGVAALWAQPCDAPNKLTDLPGSEGRYCSALVAAVRCATSSPASMPWSFTQITVVPPSTTSSMPLT
jgi:hypothetical protein